MADTKTPCIRPSLRWRRKPNLFIQRTVYERKGVMLTCLDTRRRRAEWEALLLRRLPTGISSRS